MKITTKTRYGLRALSYIAKNAPFDSENLVRIKEISENQKISIQYLEQILYSLKEKKLIIGKRGPNGGYKMAKMPEEITIYEIFNILESDVKLVVCEPGKNVCVGKDCMTVYLWNKLNFEVEKVLKNTTLKEILNEFDNKMGEVNE